MTPALLLLLRVIHVVGGSFWFGSALLNTLFLGPSVRAAGPGGGAVMAQMIRVRRLPRWINATAAVTILSGIWLYGWRSAWFTADGWMRSGAGITWGVGGLFAVVAAVTGGLVIGRAAARMGQLGAAAEASGGPPSEEVRAEMSRLQRRMGRGSVAATLLILAATVCMAVGRYV